MLRRFFLFSLLALQACASTNYAPALAPNKTMTQVIAIDAPWRGGLPVTVVAPLQSDAPLPVVLFSTGAFSSPDKYMALLEPWAQAGYAVLAPLHVDAESWTGKKPEKPQDGLTWRMRDFNALVDAIPLIAEQSGLALNPAQTAATGHSFGGMVAQILGGAKPGDAAGDIGRLPAIPVSAIVAISPPGPIANYIGPDGWSHMQAPQLLTTGTADIVPQIAPEWQKHLGGHDAHPSISLSLVAQGADHYYGNIIGRTEYPGPPQQAQFDEMVTKSRLFLDGFVRADIVLMSLFVSGATRGASDRVGLNAK